MLKIEQEIEQLNSERCEKEQLVEDLRKEWDERIGAHQKRLRKINETDLPRELALSLLGKGDEGLKRIRFEKMGIEQDLSDAKSGILEAAFEYMRGSLTAGLRRELRIKEGKRNRFFNKRKEVENSDYLGRNDKSLWQGLVDDFLRVSQECGEDALAEAKEIVEREEAA